MSHAATSARLRPAGLAARSTAFLMTTATVLSLAACGSDAGPTATTQSDESGGAATSEPSGPARTPGRDSEVDWSAPDQDGFVEAALEVPVDYRPESDVRTMSIALLGIPALDP